MDAILRPHVERTVKRIRDQARVLLSGEGQARQFRPGESRERRRHLPIEQKETYRWLKSVQVCEQVAEQVPGTRLVCIMDREGDIFEVFHHWRKSRRGDLLVRATKERRSDSPGAASLFDQVRRTPERCRVQITIPKRRDRSLRAIPSEVELTVRHAPVNLLVPPHRRRADAEPIPVWMVHAREENPPDNTTPVEWLLTLQRAVVLTGKLGGYRDRKSDPPPGVIVLWRGYAKLHAMCLGAALALGIDTN